MRSLLLVFACIGSAECLMCYQCADSDDKKGSNECQTYVKTMRKYRKRFEDTKQMDLLKRHPYRGRFVKNCTDFGGLPEDQIHCSIVSVESGGRVASYIRECCDGKEFFAAGYNKQFQEGNVISDNQTTCHYAPQGVLACVTLCKGDFCNGPSGAWTFHNNAPILAVVMLLCFMINYSS